MSEYCHMKVIRMKISEKEVCKILDAEDRWDIEDLLKAPFEIAPTADFFIDYELLYNHDAEGEWGKTRRLSNAEFLKYASKFHTLLKGRVILPSELRLVEYCWYDGHEAPDYFDDEV